MDDQDHHGHNHHDPEAAVTDTLRGSNHEDNKSIAGNEKTKKKIIEEAPRSVNWRGGANDSIPLTHSPPPQTEKGRSTTTKPTHTPRLFHPLLHKIPMQVRFGLYGTLSSALFMLMYNASIYYLDVYYVPSTIYAAVYIVFIPIQHAMASTMVFGWPDRYLASLMSNVPIGLTAIALGSYLTAYLDKIKFNQSAEDIARDYGLEVSKNSPEFFSSMFVLIVTSFWTFVLTVLVNSPAEASEKKEL